MKTDERLKSNWDLSQEQDRAKFSQLFAKNSFKDTRFVVSWLCKQLKNRIGWGIEKKRPMLDEIEKCKGLSEALDQGNNFYTTIFDQDSWIHESNQDKKDDHPFSKTVARIYDSIWCIQSENHDSSLIIYDELNTHIETEFGNMMSNENSFQDFPAWLRVEEATYDLHAFRKSWIASIELQKIEDQVDDIIHWLKVKPLHELANFMERHLEKEKKSSEYEQLIIKNSSESPLKFIHETIRESGYISFLEPVSLSESLFRRLDSPLFIRWLDALKWPVLQDHALYFVQSPENLVELISIVVDTEQKLETKKDHLLLMLLMNYFKVVEKITDNLLNLKNGEWSYQKTKWDLQVVDSAEKQYQAWLDNELKNSFTRLVDLVIGKGVFTESSYFTSVFAWINSLSKSAYENRRNPGPLLQNLDTINSVFQEKLNQDVENKAKILLTLPTEKLNWQAFDKFIGILENGESDQEFLEELFSIYQKYLKCDKFSWTTKYHDIYINQAIGLSYVVSLLTNPLEALQKMIQEFQVSYEGWQVVTSPEYKSVQKEVYIYMVGVGLAYTFYKQNDVTQGDSVFDCIFQQVTQQHRTSDLGFSEDRYVVVLQMLGHTTGKFSEAKSNELGQNLVQLIDNEESFLKATVILVTTISNQSFNLSNETKEVIKDRIEQKFWILEEKFKDEPSLGHKFKYLKECKDNILAL